MPFQEYESYDMLGLAQLIRERAVSAGEVLSAALDRIERLNPRFNAVTFVLEDLARRQITGSLPAGPLSGVPYLMKDLYQLYAGAPVSNGSRLFDGFIADHDSTLVERLKAAGIVIVGRSNTPEFGLNATTEPLRFGPTRNPWKPSHSAGGSSGGASAAVAAGMVPLALGTQTLGSVLRPASYCGVTGFKPTYGWFSLEGILPLSPSLDTLGLFTNTPADMLRLWQALDRPSGHDIGSGAGVALGAPDPLPELEPEMTAAFKSALSALRSAGITVRPVDISATLVQLADAARTVMFYEGARVHRERYQQFGDRLGQLAALVREGLEMPSTRYDEARQFIAQSRARVLELYKATPVILVPAATGPAPLGLDSTGDARMNSPWTAMGTPAISVPMRVGGGLPLGLQLTAAPGQDGRVLQTAIRVGRMLGRA